ncbi:MAG: ankyrin repeat domain-containing protein [Balneolales bacterium]
MPKAILLMVMIVFITACSTQPEIGKVLNAVESGDTDYVVSLMENGYDVNKVDSTGLSILILASHLGNYEVINYLLDNGADVNHQTNRGITAIMVAAKAGEYRITERLLAGGADLNPQTNHGWSALVLAARYGDRKMLSLLEDHEISLKLSAL